MSTYLHKIYKLITIPVLYLTFSTLVSAQGPFDTPINNPIPGTLIGLLNNILRLVFAVAGIYAFLRIVIAGLGFINAGGDPKKIEQAWNSIWQAILGLIIVVGSIALAALMGLILFGNAGAILNPQIYGPGSTGSGGMLSIPQPGTRP